LFLLPSGLFAQQGITLPEYIERYKFIAMAEMRESGIPASIKLAQAILESGFGNSELAVEANNHFGIKCHGWTGMAYFYDDDEPEECFRRYTDPIQSFLDHSEFILTRPWYAFLFELEPTDYEGWALGLKDAGYATNPRYAELLIRLINEHSLYRFDRKALDADFMIAEHYLRLPRKGGEDLDTGVVAAALTPAQRGVRPVGSHNRINYVIAREGDTPASLARELDMRRRQIINYNDLGDDDDLEAGQRVYLQPKRRKGSTEYHIAGEGETMADISHYHGIRMENLYRRNDMNLGMEPATGQKILLQGYKGSFIQYLFRRP